LGTELEQHRLRYSQKIDEIAMNFGVQQAMRAQDSVEREVTVPRGARLRTAVSIEDGYLL
jgi:hypothetical protein